ncbi:MAG: NrsF family protein [Casimicrobiaceae bacterium]
MKTDDLIASLARGAGAVEPNAVGRRYGTAIGWGGFGATLAMAIFLGVRPDLHEAAGLPMFWIKLAFPAALFAIALALATRLSRPAMPLGSLPRVLAVPVIAVWVLAAVELVAAPPAQRASLVLGRTWDVCPIFVALLSVPVFIGAFWAMRRLAPTQLVRAGATCGLVAGALGASIYALHCDEMSAAFLGTWYVIGMLIPTVAGALLGPKLLRW